MEDRIGAIATDTWTKHLLFPTEFKTDRVRPGYWKNQIKRARKASIDEFASGNLLSRLKETPSAIALSTVARIATAANAAAFHGIAYTVVSTTFNMPCSCRIVPRRLRKMLSHANLAAKTEGMPDVDISALIASLDRDVQCALPNDDCLKALDAKAGRPIGGLGRRALDQLLDIIAAHAAAEAD